MLRTDDVISCNAGWDSCVMPRNRKKDTFTQPPMDVNKKVSEEWKVWQLQLLIQGMRTGSATWGDFPSWLPSYEVKSCFFLVPGKMRPPSPVPPKTLFLAKIMPDTVDNFLKVPTLKPLGISKSTNVKIISPMVPHGLLCWHFCFCVFRLADRYWLIQADWLMNFPSKIGQIRLELIWRTNLLIPKLPFWKKYLGAT